MRCCTESLNMKRVPVWVIQKTCLQLHQAWSLMRAHCRLSSGLQYAWKGWSSLPPSPVPEWHQLMVQLLSQGGRPDIIVTRKSILIQAQQP